MEWAVFLGIVGMTVLVGVYLRRITPRKGKMLSDEDLREVAEQMAALKTAALANFTSPDNWDGLSPGDPRTVSTKSGQILMYTVSHVTPGKYVHHASSSAAVGYDLRATGVTLILLWSKLVGIPINRCALGRSQRFVHHAEYVLDENEQQEFARRPVDTPAEKWIQTFLCECPNALAGLQWSPWQVEWRPLDPSETARLNAYAEDMAGIMYEVVCGLDQYRRFGTVNDTAEVRLTLLVGLSLRDHFSRTGSAMIAKQDESNEIWGALACAVAEDLEKACRTAAMRSREPASVVSVVFPRGICAYVHEMLGASIANTNNPAREVVAAPELFRGAAEGLPPVPQ